jgi:plasmid maintenance system antidote protein VapI
MNFQKIYNLAHQQEMKRLEQKSGFKASPKMFLDFQKIYDLAHKIKSPSVIKA